MSNFCPFCRFQNTESDRAVIAENKHAFIVRDGFPVSEGHTLFIPKRHVGSFFEATEDERQALLQLLDQAKIDIETHYKPDAYNIGINDGLAAGQTVAHLHIHLIPRYEGQAADPRGGVRWVVPEKADYWSAP